VAITVALGAGGLAAAVLIANLARGIYERAVSDAARSGPGDLTVLPRAAGSGDAARRFADAGLVASLAAIPGVEAALPRLSSPGLAAHGAAVRAVVLLGVDLARERDTNPALRTPPGAPAAGSHRDGVLVAAALAKVLGVSPGDRVELAVPREGGDATRAERVVSAVLDPSLDAIADRAVYIDARELQELSGAPGRLDAVAVLLRAGGPRRAAARRVERVVAAFPGLRVATWEETLPMLRDAIALDRFGHRLLLAAVIVVVGLGAAVAVAASAIERTREQGLLAAIGAGPATVARVVLAEGLLLGAAAVGAGLLLGVAATAALARWGLDLRPLLGDAVAYGGVLVPLRVHAGWDWPETLLAAAAVLAAHAAAGLAGAAPAIRRPPAAALRFR